MRTLAIVCVSLTTVLITGCKAPEDITVYIPYALEGSTTANSTTRISGNGTNFHLLKSLPTIALSSDMKRTARVLEQYGDTLIVVDKTIGNGTRQEIYIVAP